MSEYADTTTRIGRMSLNEDEVREWARQARGMWGVPIRVYKRSLSCGGIVTFIHVAVLWPKGTGTV